MRQCQKTKHLKRSFQILGVQMDLHFGSSGDHFSWPPAPFFVTFKLQGGILRGHSFWVPMVSSGTSGTHLGGPRLQKANTILQPPTDTKSRNDKKQKRCFGPKAKTIFRPKSKNYFSTQKQTLFFGPKAKTCFRPKSKNDCSAQKQKPFLLLG